MLIELAKHLQMAAERYEVEHEGLPALTTADWALEAHQNPYSHEEMVEVSSTARENFIGNFSYLLCYYKDEKRPYCRQIVVYAPSRAGAVDELAVLWPENAGWCATDYETLPVLARGLTPAAALEETQKRFADNDTKVLPAPLSAMRSN